MRDIEEILRSTSDALFPADGGAAAVRLDSRGYDGDSPLHVLLWRNDTEGSLVLIAAGADVNALGEMDDTPLYVAVSNENLAAIRALLKAGANPDLRSKLGFTPRELALQKGELCASAFAGV